MLKRLVESKLTTAPAAGTTSEWTWVASRADMPVQHRDLSALYATWLRAKGTVGDLPAWSDFSADDLDQWLGRICLVQQGEQELELEVLGCCLTDQYGHDISRQPLSAATSGPLGEDARDMFEAVIGLGIIGLPCGVTYSRGRCLSWHGIALPLANGSALVCLFHID